MSLVHRLASAARDGRLASGVHRRLLQRVAAIQERYFRFVLRLRRVDLNDLPAIGWHGDASASPDSARLKDCFGKACQGISDLSDEIRNIDGMSGQKYRSFINNLVHSCPDARYLEIGSWAGSTATAALYGNTVEALCIDNWSQFGGPRSAFFSNIESVLSEKINFRFLEMDFRSVDFSSVGPFNIYLFDGPHEEVDQYDGIRLVQSALAERYLLVVDDWNWRAVRNGTFRALIDAKSTIEAAIEVRTTSDDSKPSITGKESDWHNGYFLASIVKARAVTVRA